MEDQRALAAEATFRRISDLIEEADQMDPTNPTTVHVVIMEGDGRWECWIGPNRFAGEDNDLIVRYSRLKAEISLRTGKSVYDVLHNDQSLLLPHEQELRSDRASHKLHAGGVPIIGRSGGVSGSVGISGAGRGLDCFCAKLGASEYRCVRERLSSKAA